MKPYEQSGVMSQGPIELAVIEAGARLAGQEAQTALDLVAMSARRHPNPVVKAAAMAMEQDFYQE